MTLAFVGATEIADWHFVKILKSHLLAYVQPSPNSFAFIIANMEIFGRELKMFISVLLSCPIFLSLRLK